MLPNINSPVAPALALPAELTYPQATAILAHLQQALARQSGSDAVLVLDASALSVFDSSALAVLLECRRTVLRRGLSLQVHGLPTALEQMAALYGVDKLLGLSTESVE